MKPNEPSAISRRPSARKNRAAVVVGILFVCAVQSVFSQSTNVPARLTYDSFRTISDRNIFNPSRYARSTDHTNTRTNSQPASRVESFSLVGIMAYEKGCFAFFDGTKEGYKQALQADGTIGDYKVVRVTADEVKLATGTNTFVLKVGMQMRREDEGNWFLSDGSESTRTRIVSTRTRTRGGSHGESSPGGETDGMVNGEEPGVILENGTTSETSATENPANNSGDAAPAEADAGDGRTTDPVLIQLMERRQRALNP